MVVYATAERLHRYLPWMPTDEIFKNLKEDEAGTLEKAGRHILNNLTRKEVLH